MKQLFSIITLSLLLTAVAIGQSTSSLFMLSGGNAVYAVDFDGATEYMSKTSPFLMDLNDVNRVTDIERNSDFEDNATDWATNGTHVMTVTSSAPLSDTYSGLITSSGIGDATTNYVSLSSEEFSVLEDGKKYTLQIEARAVEVDTDVTIQIGDSSKVFTAVDNSATEVLVWNFEYPSVYLTGTANAVTDQQGEANNVTGWAGLEPVYVSTDTTSGTSYAVAGEFNNSNYTSNYELEVAYSLVEGARYRLTLEFFLIIHDHEITDDHRVCRNKISV